MKENVERRSLFQRVFPPISKEEDAKTFSKERAKRGAKIAGVAIGSGLPVAAALAASVTKEIGSADIEPFVKIAVFHTLFWAGVGAVADGFKPTSRLIGFRLENEIKIAKGIPGAIKKLRNK